MRALDFIHEIFTGLSVTAPLPKPGALAPSFFAQQQAVLMIAPSELRATLTGFPYAITVLPQDMERASLARVNGWAVTAHAPDKDAARALANYLSWQPVHAGWSSIQPPPADTQEDSPVSVCHAALAQALVPRLDASTSHMAQFLDQQLNQLAHNPAQTPEVLYAKIQAEVQAPTSPPAVRGDAPTPNSTLPAPKTDASTQLRGL